MYPGHDFNKHLMEGRWYSRCPLMSAYYILTSVFNSLLTTSAVFSCVDFNKPGTVIWCKMKIREKLMSAYPAVVPRLFVNSCRALRAGRLKHQAFNVTLPDHIYFVVSVRNSACLMFVSMGLRAFKANSSHTYLQGMTTHLIGLSRTAEYVRITFHQAEKCLYFIFLFFLFFTV